MNPRQPTSPVGLHASGVDRSQRGVARGFSKIGVIRLARTAVAWTSRGARVLSLPPGIIDTSMGPRAVAATRDAKRDQAWSGSSAPPRSWVRSS
jgi:NAD(P)-dependent dehydrogenase (short-subunit alcohol dehydrogenase family)